MVSRRGAASSGCLSWLLLAAVVAYVGTHVGEPYYRYYRYSDVVSQQARFASVRADDAIMRSIWASADSLGLPEEAYHLTISRAQGAIRISGAYDDYWSLLKYSRSVHYSIDTEAGL